MSYFNAVDFLLVGLVVAEAAAILWLMWLHAETYQRLRTSDRDRDRLIRRIGVYHSLPLITPSERLPELPAETPIPSAFRMKRPTPPPGYKPDKVTHHG